MPGLSPHAMQKRTPRRDIDDIDTATKCHISRHRMSRPYRELQESDGAIS